MLVGFWLLEFYIFATSKVIPEQIPTCDNARVWQLGFILLHHWEIRLLAP